MGCACQAETATLVAYTFSPSFQRILVAAAVDLELVGAAARIERHSICEDVENELEVVRRNLKRRK